MAKTVRRRGGKRLNTSGAKSGRSPARRKRGGGRPKSGKGPVFIIDPQEEGIRTLVEYSLAPPPTDIIEVTGWEQLMEASADFAANKVEGGFGPKGPVQMLIYGPSGVGKTSVAAHFPPNTLVFDSLTGLEKLCFQYHCEQHFDGDWSKDGFYAYMQGPKQAAKTDWPEWLDVLTAVRKAGWNVVLLAHSTPPKTYNNPEGPDFDRWYVYLDKETWSQTHRWTRATLFYNYSVELEKRGLKTKAKADVEERFLYTQWSPAFDAKNQYGMQPVIDAGGSGSDAFEALLKEFS